MNWWAVLLALLVVTAATGGTVMLHASEAKTDAGFIASLLGGLAVLLLSFGAAVHIGTAHL